jgi:hypothetical protein
LSEIFVVILAVQDIHVSFALSPSMSDWVNVGPSLVAQRLRPPEAALPQTLGWGLGALRLAWTLQVPPEPGDKISGTPKCAIMHCATAHQQLGYFGAIYAAVHTVRLQL